MANELNIGVKFGAEGVPQVTKSITDLTNQLKRFQQGLNNATGVDSIARLNRAIDETKTRIQNLQKFTGATGEKLSGGIVQGSNQAANALTNLSRIAQDAPFGFIGITNNINPLLESFQRLKAETGSTGGAIKALGSSLLGAGGLGLAVGIGSALLTVFGDKLFGIGKAAQKAKDDAEELARTIRDMAVIQGEAVGGVQGQIAQVNALATAVGDSNKPYAERKRALEELKGINKAYFGNLQLEDAATGKLTKTIEEYNKALVAQAIVKAFVNEIADVAKAAAKADTELAKATTKLTQAEKELAKARAEGRPTGREGTGVSSEEVRANSNLISAFKEQRAQREKLLDIETQRAVLTDQLNKAQAEALRFKSTETKGAEAEKDFLNEQLKLLEKIRDLREDIRPERSKEGILDIGKLRSDIAALAKVEAEIGELKIRIAERDAKKSKLPDEQIRAIVDGIKKSTQENIDKIFQNEAILLESIPKLQFTRVELAPLTQEQKDALAKGAKELPAFSGLAKDGKDIKIESDRAIKIRLFGIKFVEAEEQAKEAVKKLKETILNSTVGALTDTADLFGQTLGSIFSGGGIGESISKAAQGLLNIIGNALQQIGKQIIATSALVETLKKALDSLFGPGGTALGFAVGAALVALGGLMKGIKIPAFAGGVNNFGGGLALVGERGPELVNLPRGSDVIPNHMIGSGTPTIVLQPSLRYSGRDLVVMVQQVLESNSRMGGASL